MVTLMSRYTGERRDTAALNNAWVRLMVDGLQRSCTVLGLCSFGPLLDATARLLPGEEASRAARKLARKYPVQRRFLIPLLYRTWGRQMVHYELLAPDAAAARACARRASGVPDRQAINLGIRVYGS